MILSVSVHPPPPALHYWSFSCPFVNYSHSISEATHNENKTIPHWGQPGLTITRMVHTGRDRQTQISNWRHRFIYLQPPSPAALLSHVPQSSAVSGYVYIVWPRLMWTMSACMKRDLLRPHSHRTRPCLFFIISSFSGHDGGGRFVYSKSHNAGAQMMAGTTTAVCSQINPRDSWRWVLWLHPVCPPIWDHPQSSSSSNGSGHSNKRSSRVKDDALYCYRTLCTVKFRFHLLAHWTWGHGTFLAWEMLQRFRKEH